MNQQFMKLGALALLLTAGFTACKKDKLKSTTTPDNDSGLMLMSASTSSPVLNLTTLQEYETIVEEVEGSPVPNAPNGFVSLKSVLDDLENSKFSDSTGEAYLSHPHLSDTIYEDYGRLLDILNEDKVIQLNGYLVRVDLRADSVYTINSKVQNSYSILVNNTANDSLKAYPTYMEVGLMLFGINIFSCQEPWAKSDKDKEYDAGCGNNKEKGCVSNCRDLLLFSSESQKSTKTLVFFWNMVCLEWYGAVAVYEHVNARRLPAIT